VEISVDLQGFGQSWGELVVLGVRYPLSDIAWEGECTTHEFWYYG